MKSVIIIFGLFIVSLFYISFASAVFDSSGCDPLPVSLWKFDGDASDSVDGNDGFGTGITYTQAGKVGQAVIFGSDEGQYIVVNHASSLTPSSNKLSIEFWFKPTSDPFDDYLISKQGYKIKVLGTTTDKLQVEIGDKVLTSTTTIVAGTWYYIVVTWDGTIANLYVDGSTAEDTDSPVAVTYGTDNLIIGKETAATQFNFVGLIDELAIYNTALTTTQIADHYANSLGADDYCYVSSGDTSDTRKDFTLPGCDVPGLSTKLAVNTCFRGEPYDGEYYCEGAEVPVLRDTANYPKACTLSESVGRSCCPVNSICRESTEEDGFDDEEERCYIRTEVCSTYESEGDCLDNSCYWVDGGCKDPNDPSLSCSVYQNKPSCEDDYWHFGQLGAGTEVCGSFTSTGMVIPIDSCKCVWILGDEGEECVFSYSVSNEFYGPGEDDGLFYCLKSFETDACEDGKQNVSWTVIVDDPDVSFEPKPEDLEAAQCYDDSVIRSCGQPIVTVPFFGFWNLIAAFLLIGLFYLFYKEDL